MHATVHIISKKKLSEQDVENIMDPFCEDKAPMVEDDWVYYNPDFHWDYYDIQKPIRFPKIEECYVLIDTIADRLLIREHFDETTCTFIDDSDKFNDYILKNKKSWLKSYMTELDYHW